MLASLKVEQQRACSHAWMKCEVYIVTYKISCNMIAKKDEAKLNEASICNLNFTELMELKESVK